MFYTLLRIFALTCIFAIPAAAQTIASNDVPCTTAAAYPAQAFSARTKEAGGVTLAQVVSDFLGQPGKAPISKKVRACSATPFGNITMSIDQAALNMAELEKVTLADAITEVLNNRHLRACYEVCVFGVCFTYCD